MYANFTARAVGLTLSAEATIDPAAAAWFGGVDLLIRDLADVGNDPRAPRRRMDDLGPRGRGLALAGRVAGRRRAVRARIGTAPPAGRDGNGPRPVPVRDLGPLRDARAARDRAEAGRATHLAATVASHLERQGAIARTLDGFGHRLELEVIGVASARTGRGVPFVPRLADLDRVFVAVWAEAPNVGTLLDSFHWDAAGETVEAGLAWGVGRVV